MVKEPRPGRVKTRLARGIGSVGAAWWFRHQCRTLFARLQDPRWQLGLAVSPDRAINARIWPKHLSRNPQGRGNLGRRMARALASVPKAPVAVIGADIPGVTRSHIARAFAVLRTKEAVIGPSEDGGYWLIGLKRGQLAHPRMFDGVAWSSSETLVQSETALAHLRLGRADMLRDVDEMADLALAPRIPLSAPRAFSMPRVRAS